MKIAVCIPHYGDVKAKFVKSLSDMLIHTAGATVNYGGTILRPQIKVLWEEDGPLELKRTRLVKRAQAGGAEYLLFVDTDQTFPPDALLALAQRDQAIVGCNYLTRHEPFGPTALALTNKRIQTTEAKAKANVLEKVGALGLGFCLIKVPVFDQVKGQQLFRCEISPEGQLVCGEDVHFFNVVRRAGVKVFLDHALSWRIGHLIERERFNSEGEGLDADRAFSATGP